MCSELVARHAEVHDTTVQATNNPTFTHLVEVRPQQQYYAVNSQTNLCGNFCFVRVWKNGENDSYHTRTAQNQRTICFLHSRVLQE